MKALSAPALAALARGSVGIVQLVALDFTVPIYLNTSTWDLTWQRRVNLLAYSEQLDNAAWNSYYGLAAQANVATDPLGGMTADSLYPVTGGGATGVARYYASGNVVTAQPYTFSVYLKAGGITTATLGALGTAGAGASAPAFDLALTQDASGTNWTQKYVGNGWHRCSVTVTPTAGTRYCNVGFSPAQPYPGDTTKNVYVWGAQLEPGDLATPYTPTTTTTINEPGVIYKGAYGLGTISAVQDKPGDISGITLELAAGSPAIIALALDGADEVQGTVCTIRTAIIDTNTYQILDAPIEWAGTLDTMGIGEDGTTAVVSVSAESKAVDLLRGTPRMYTDEEQTLINPTDRCFKYVVDQADKPLIWPSRSYYQQ